MRLRPSWLILLTIPFSALHAQTDSLPDVVIVMPDTGVFRFLRNPGAVNLMSRSHEFRGAGVDTVYTLPDGFIVHGSERIVIGGASLHRDRDYTIRYRAGEIWFRYAIAPDVPIRVTYAILPFRLRSEYYHRRLASTDVYDDTLKTTVRKDVAVRPYGQRSGLFESSNIAGSGTITRGFTVGSNQDFTLNSGLNIQIAGNITDDVTLEASLTDENTPIQPEGNTENLQEIDKVFIEIRKADEYAATFGDFNVQLGGTEFGGYTRQLQGVRASVNKKNLAVGVAMASSKGKYATNNLVIQEGVQGPYELRGENGESNILVVAGTEKVWLNGVRLTRGEDNDYVIDYGAGQITFTRKRLITSESRVVVDFEYTDEVFRRNSISASVRSTWWERKLSVGGVVIRESDDKNNPVNLALSDALVDSLSRMDDDSLSRSGNVIFVDGATYVGPGRGAYLKRLDAASGDSIFEYVGADSSGDYNVRFTEVGASQGDYRRGDVLGEFVFVGRGLATHLPLVPLSLPKSATLGTVFFDANPVKNVKIGAEMAWSSFDQNSFSPSSRHGQAYHVRTGVANQKITLGNTRLGEVDFDGRIRHRDSTFHQVDRLDQSEFNRNWNLDAAVSPYEAAFNRPEDLLDLSARYRPVKGIQLLGQYGRLEQGPYFESIRRSVGFQSTRDKWPLISYTMDNIGSRSRAVAESDVTRHYLLSSYTVWKVRPGFDFESEEVRSTSLIVADSGYGSAFETYRPRLDVTGFAKTQFGVLFEARTDRLRNTRSDSLNGTVSLSTTQRYYWNVSSWKDLTSTIEFIRRRKQFRGRFRTADNPDKSTNLINTTVDYYPWRRAVAVNLNYQVSEERVQDRKIIFIPVQPNTGNFIRVGADSFRQVPQGQGDWIQGSVRSGSFTPIVELKFGARLRVEFSKFFARRDEVRQPQGGWEAFVSTLTTETTLRVEENQRKPGTWFYFLDLGRFQRDQNTLRGSIFLRQDVYSAFTARELSIRLRYELQKNLSNALLDGSERRKRQLENIRVRKQVTARLALEAEVEYETNVKQTTFVLSGLSRDFDLVRIKALPALLFKPVTAIELNNRMSLLYAKDKLSDLRAKVVGLSPEFIYSFRQKGRASLSGEFTRVIADDRREGIPFELTDGNVRGWNLRWLMVIDYRISNHVSASMNYQGRKEPRQKMIHFGGAEFRAFF